MDALHVDKSVWYSYDVFVVSPVLFFVTHENDVKFTCCVPMIKHARGFTLAELLIALLLVGLIVSFTIPKVLQASGYTKYNAITKEMVGAISGAYMAYKQDNIVLATTKSTDLIPYLNYIKQDTSTAVVGFAYNTCSSADPCLWFANGALVQLERTSFAGTTTLNAINMSILPDGTKAPGDGTDLVGLFLYYNGRITTSGKCLPNSVTSDGTWNPDPSSDPTWLSW